MARFTGLLRNGHVVAVRYLVRNGASGMSKAVGVDSCNYCLIMGARQAKGLKSATRSGNVIIAGLLLDSGAAVARQRGQYRRPRHQGRTALHLAAMNGHYDIVKLLLERGGKSIVVNKFGRTAECWAVANGHTRVAQLLSHPKPK
jgi:hypothetical protein